MVCAAVSLLGATTASAQSAEGTSRRDRLRQRYSQAREGTVDVSEAARMLRGSESDERLEGARQLARSGDPEAVAPLIAAVSDDDMRVRIKAIDGLGNLRANEATNLLVQQLFLKSTTPAEQRRVLAALGKIRDPRSTEPICEFLSQDLDQETRGTAIFALGEIGDAAAVDALEGFVANEEDPLNSRLASEAIHKITHQAPGKVEIRALADDRQTRGQAP